MPYKTDKMKLDSPFLDRRVKLLPCQREMVLYWTAQGLSQRNLAKMFKVSRRLITFIQDPKKKEKCLENRAARGGWKQYYKGGEEWASTMKDHRRYKHKVLTKTK
jgi:transposase